VHPEDDHCGIADLWKYTICQSAPRFATTKLPVPNG
jgi:hypothetical protein